MTPPPTPPETAFQRWNLSIPINGLAWSPTEPHTLAIACGDGTLRLARPGLGQPMVMEIAPESALLSLVPTPHGFASGSDSGHIHLTTPQGETSLLTRLPDPFVEHLAYSSHANQLLATTGKTLTCLHLPSGEPAATHTLPSSIGGLATSPIGRRAAATHYNGATIFDLANPANPPRKLEWKGSHLTTTYSPDGTWLVTAMQEQAIHLWRLSNAENLHMRGYMGPVTQFSWSHDGRALTSNGGGGAPLWPFTSGHGPAGQTPQVLADSGSPDLLVTAVECHPKGPFIAMGYTDGLVLLANTQSQQCILLQAPKPLENGQQPSPQHTISRLAWSPDGLALAFSTEEGTLTLADFTQLV